MNETLKELLPSLPIFGGLSDDELEHIAGLLQWHDFEDGQIIAAEGDVGTQMFIVAEGHIRVTHEGGDDAQPFVLAELRPGDCVGEMALIEIKPRSATIRAHGTVTVCSLSNADFLHLYATNLQTYTLMVLNVARELSRRLRKANEVISACARSLSESYLRRV
ncbi:MAG: CRP/FNR family cyclic AMP-dependent transcriptional regulator [Myxococcota bacterium]|jgi:CRP/FNR family cyclic AMP-dependent transcriptional regulator